MTDFDASAQLFSQAAVLLMVGMGFVFAFLSLLIMVIKVLISPLGSRFPDSAPAVKNNAANSSNGMKKNTSATVAAISAAIKQYRQKHKP